MDEFLRQKLAREMTHQQPVQSERPLADMWAGMNNLQRVGMLPIPFVSDAAGLLGDIQMYREQPEQRGLFNYAMSGMGLLPFVPGAFGRIVHHGSPHQWMPEPDFPRGRPRLDKIGTGEGAQAYGHGMYFAESPGVAKSYMFAGQPNQWYDTSAAKYGNKSIDKLYENARRQVDMMDRARVSVDQLAYKKAIAESQFWEYLMSHQHPQMAINDAITNADDWPELAEFARKLDAKKFSGVPEVNASMYTLDLPDEKLPGLLDWDAPLSEQPEAVRKAIDSLPTKAKEAIGLERLTNRKPGTHRQFTGADLANSLSPDDLLGAGIPGLRYLDAGSRKAGDGTYNYVIWDQALLDEMARRMK